MKIKVSVSREKNLDAPSQPFAAKEKKGEV